MMSLAAEGNQDSVERVIVLRDFDIKEIEIALEDLRDNPPDSVGEILVPGLGQDQTQGEIFRDIVQPQIKSANRALALVDLPNANVGFEIGYALGSGLPVGLAAARERVPDWLKKPPLDGFGVKMASDIDALVTLLAEKKWIKPPQLPESGEGVLFICPDAGVGKSLRRQVTRKKPDWKMLPSAGWNLNDLGSQFDGIGTVVWAITAYPPGTDERDGKDNAAGSVLAGLALASDRRLIVLQDENARAVVDPKPITLSFATLGHFQALIEDIDAKREPEPEEADPLANYRTYLRKVHDRLIPFFPQASRTHMSEVYVDLEFEKCLADDGESESGAPIEDLEAAWVLRGQPGKGRGTATLADLLTFTPNTTTETAARWAILGEPGAGKTTAARHLSWEFAGRDDAPVPVFLSLPRLATEKGHPFRLAEEDARAALGDTQAAGIEAKLRELADKRADKSGGVLLLLDGLDEVAPEHRNAIHDLITVLSEDLPEFVIAVFSRQVGYQDIGPDFRRASLRPLSENSQKKLLRHWLGTTAGKETWERIQTRPSLQSVAQNPLMLTLIASLSLARPDLPTSRVRLYDWAIDLLLERGFGATPKAVKDPHAARKILGTLSLSLQRSPNEQWTGKELEEQLFELERVQPELKDRWQGTWRSRTDFLQDVATHSGLIGERDGPRSPWRFLHRQLREFLAAEALARSGQDGLRELVATLDEDDVPRWAETLGLFCGLAEDPQEALKVLRGFSSATARRVLPEVEGIQPARSLELLVDDDEWEYDDLVRLARSWRSGGCARQEVTTLLGSLIARQEGQLDRLAQLHLVMAREGLEPDREEFFQACGLPLDRVPALDFQSIPAGRFAMGSPEDEDERYSDESPLHEVEVPEFELAAVPVTVSQYAHFDPSRSDDQSEYPIVGVSWWAAYLFCQWIGAHLPSESQWEYACRAGSATRFWSGDEEDDLAEVGWFDGNSGGVLHPVGEKGANDFGLHDMHGNVWEWCQDHWSSDYGESAGAHPGPYEVDGLRVRVVRGGGFGFSAGCARSAYRIYWRPGDRGRILGFRPARVTTS